MEKTFSEKNSGWSRINSPKSTFQIKEFNNQVHLVNGLGEVFTVNPNGSLAVLALGALGQKATSLSKKINEKK